MKIILDAPVEIVEQVQVKRIIESIDVIAIVDDFKSVSATVSFNGDDLNPKTYQLWKEGQEYEDCGQYTDQDIINRVIEII